MKVKLKTGRTAQVDGRFESQLPGDVIDVETDEGQRLIDAGSAESVSKVTTTKRKPKSDEDE